MLFVLYPRCQLTNLAASERPGMGARSRKSDPRASSSWTTSKETLRIKTVTPIVFSGRDLRSSSLSDRAMAVYVGLDVIFTADLELKKGESGCFCLAEDTAVGYGQGLC